MPFRPSHASARLRHELYKARASAPPCHDGTTVFKLCSPDPRGIGGSHLFTRSLFGASTKHLQVIDAHAEGEPARVVIGGTPQIPGNTVAEKRLHMMEKMDELRKLLLLEPRGYPCQNANFIVPSSQPEASFGFIIAEQNKIYPMMSGHNAMCVATVLLETGMVPMIEPVSRFKLEAPAGLVHIEAACNSGRVQSVTLYNQPAFCRPNDMDLNINVPHLGNVSVSIAYGGMWYAIVEASSIGLDLDPSNGRQIVRLGEMIKVATREQHPVNHPDFDYPGPDILCFRGRTNVANQAGSLRSRNAVVMSNGTLDWNRPETFTGMLDRSPCGTGTCAVMAMLYARGELGLEEDFVHESIIGSEFVGRLHTAKTAGAGTSAERVDVHPSVRGRAWITSHATIVCDPRDPFPAGYTVGDIW